MQKFSQKKKKRKTKKSCKSGVFLIGYNKKRIVILGQIRWNIKSIFF